jgi:hypothetical protein
MPEVNIAVLTKDALTFRNALEVCDKRHLPLSLRKYPRGNRGDAPFLLAKYLEDKGHGVFNYMLGYRDGLAHAWLQVDNLVVDIDADLFPDRNERVIVVFDSVWHRVFNGEIIQIADFEILDDPMRLTLRNAYRRILSNITTL